ncbi:MAG: type II secretion system protein GspK [Pseudomonadota bacterium]|nr:type II secretion system protein GspK [Pseudomonadota bacterium]
MRTQRRLSRRRRPRQCGIALMLVLWVIALLTILAVGMTGTQRTESALATNQLATARFRALAEAGISFAVLNLMAAPPLVPNEASDVWVPDGRVRAWAFAGETLHIAVFNEASAIDLNQASQELLKGLLEAAGVAPEQVPSLVDAILDWRDEDDLHSLNGAEDDDYAAAQRPYGAKDGPFDSVEELLQVLGFNRELYLVLAPALSVSASSNPAEPDFASPIVLASMEGISLEDARIELEERADGLFPGGEPAGVRPLSRGGPLYRIRVTRATEGAPTMAMEALVRVTASSAAPFNVLWRRFGLVAEQPSAGEEDADGYAEP